MLHASGSLAVSEAAPFDLTVWPPQDAVPVDVDGFYEALAGAGFGYGPAFQGVQAVWRDDTGVYADVALAESVDGFGIHPALFDAALHPSGLLAEGGSGPRLPFAWSGVELFAVGATALRVAITPSGEGVRVQAADGTGQPVAVVHSLISRTVSADQLSGTTMSGDALFAVDWVTVPPAAETLDRAAWTTLTVGKGPVGEAVGRVLRGVQEWLADEQSFGSRLAVMTRGAVPAGTGDVVDLPGAAVWGLVRSAQSEHPDRIVLVDADPGVEDVDLSLVAVVGEPQVAIRDGVVLVPRLARAGSGGGLVLPAGGWRLTPGADGTLEGLRAEATDPPPLDAGQVRVAIPRGGREFP